jgi:putative membrane protein
MFHLLLSLHLISVVCWFAGLFYLPRLFVYHAMTEDEGVFRQFKVMEFKLYYFIMHPSLLLTLLTGGGLIILYCTQHSEGFPAMVPSDWFFWTFWLRNWLVWKLFLVAGLILFHIQCGQHLKRFRSLDDPASYKASPHYKTHRFFRLFNEVPTIILIAVVFLAVYKP